MNRRDFLTQTSASLAAALSTRSVFGQEQAVRPDLAALAERKGLRVFNRHVSQLEDGPRRGVRFDEAPGQGIAYVDGLDFANGTIELDIRGRDVVAQPSLVVTQLSQRRRGMVGVWVDNFGGDVANLAIVPAHP